MVSKQTMQYVTIGAIAILLLTTFGYLNLGDMIGVTPDQPAPGTVLPDGTVIPVIPDASIRAAKAQWAIEDAITQTATASGDAAYVGVLKGTGGVFNPLVSSEKTELDASPDTSAKTYSAGDSLVVSVTSDNDPTGGYEAYPRWFYIKSLDHNAKVMAFPVGNPISAISQSKGSTGSYTFTVNENVLVDTGNRVAWLEGSTNYWDFGTFALYGRVAKDYMIQSITNKGTVGTTLNDGATWDDTDAEINANFTFTSDSEDLMFELRGEANDVCFGLPTLAVSANGQVNQYNAVLVFSTDALGVDQISIAADDWHPISKPDLTADVAFYYIINPLSDGGIPNPGNTFSISVPITINDASLTASTEYEFEGWVLDWQNVNNVAIGATTTSLPSNNGFISDAGCDSIVEPRALTVSSGSAATMQMMGHFTTNA